MFVEVKDTVGTKHFMNMENIAEMAYQKDGIMISFNGLKDHIKVSDADGKRLETMIRNNQ